MPDRGGLLARLAAIVDEVCSEPCAGDVCKEIRRVLQAALAGGPHSSLTLRVASSVMSVAAEVLAGRGCLEEAEALEEASSIAALLSRASGG